MDEKWTELINSILNHKSFTAWEEQFLTLNKTLALNQQKLELETAIEIKLDHIINEQFDRLLNEKWQNYQKAELAVINQKLDKNQISQVETKQEIEKLIAFTLLCWINDQLETEINQTEASCDKKRTKQKPWKWLQTDAYWKKLNHDEIKLAENKVKFQENQAIITTQQVSLTTTIAKMVIYTNDQPPDNSSPIRQLKNILLELENKKAELEKTNAAITQNNEINELRTAEKGLWKLFSNESFSNANKNWIDYHNWTKEIIKKINKILQETPTESSEKKLQLKTLAEIINTSYCELYRNKEFIQTYIAAARLEKETITAKLQLLQEQKNEGEINQLTFQKAVVENRIVQFQTLQNHENPELLIKVNKKANVQ